MKVEPPHHLGWNGTIIPTYQIIPRTPTAEELTIRPPMSRRNGRSAPEGTESI